MDLLRLKRMNGHKYLRHKLSKLHRKVLTPTVVCSRLGILNDFDLNDHGFCIVKVAKEVKNGGIQNQAELIGQGKNKGIRFHPIGQEETDNGGTREILDIGTELSSEVLMKNKMWHWV